MKAHQRLLYAVWVVFICAFAALHALHLRADFPNHSPWWMDWAKYTDEGWYGNAAIRAHLFGSWYLPGDFNPAPAVPLWPFLEWLLFFITGVSVQAARGLAVTFFFASLGLSYLLMRGRVPLWAALLALTLLVTSPFLYCFSRLAILEPMLIALTLGTLNLCVRLARFRRPLLVSLNIGLLFTLMMLTKTTAIFLLPSLVWCMVLPLGRSERRKALRCVLTAAGAFALSYGVWMALVVRAGMLADYEYLFTVNRYLKPKEWYWPLVSFWWSLHGALWVDRILMPLAGAVMLGAIVLQRGARMRGLLNDPVFGASLLAVGGYVVFMTYQNHPQPRYFSVVAWFGFLIVAQGAGWLLAAQTGVAETRAIRGMARRIAGWLVTVPAVAAAATHASWTVESSMQPEYTFVQAAEGLTNYIDTHPNGKRLLVSVSGDEITLVTHLPALNDLFVSPGSGMVDLGSKLAYYRPGWYATWNTLDAGALEDLHTIGTVEQVASFHAFDDSTRDVLVLFKVHPWPDGGLRDPGDEDLRLPVPEDKFSIPLD